jgi:hypothetical protein
MHFLHPFKAIGLKDSFEDGKGLQTLYQFTVAMRARPRTNLGRFGLSPSESHGCLVGPRRYRIGFADLTDQSSRGYGWCRRCHPGLE